MDSSGLEVELVLPLVLVLVAERPMASVGSSGGGGGGGGGGSSEHEAADEDV